MEFRDIARILETIPESITEGSIREATDVLKLGKEAMESSTPIDMARGPELLKQLAARRKKMDTNIAKKISKEDLDNGPETERVPATKPEPSPYHHLKRAAKAASDRAEVYHDASHLHRQASLAHRLASRHHDAPTSDKKEHERLARHHAQRETDIEREKETEKNPSEYRSQNKRAYDATDKAIKKSDKAGHATAVAAHSKAHEHPEAPEQEKAAHKRLIKFHANKAGIRPTIESIQVKLEALKARRK